jgi:hypothetical protein
VIKKGTQLNNMKLVNTDDQILMTTSEAELQTMAYRLNLITRKYKTTMFSTKTKSMATAVFFTFYLFFTALTLMYLTTPT